MRRCWTAVVSAALLFASMPASSRSVSSLGRIEPLDGVYQLAGPSDTSVVAQLFVVEGQTVNHGDVLATLDTFDVRSAELRRAEVDLNHARSVMARERALKQRSSTSVARLEEAERDVQLGEADLTAARARLAQAQVTAPVNGQVLIIHARTGERIGPDGLLELGQTERMYVVAEVYETDIALVRVGQKAVVSSPALGQPITGTVERIGKLIGKNDILDLDPVARMDSRVIEVFILLDDAQAVASLTNLQVDVEISQ